MRGYLLDEGVLLTEENEEFRNYATVYDKKYGYYDEDQHYLMNEEKAIETAKQYVENGVENTYAVVSNIILPDDFNIDENGIRNEEYTLDDVIYSIAKIDEKIVEHFVNK